MVGAAGATAPGDDPPAGPFDSAREVPRAASGAVDSGAADSGTADAAETDSSATDSAGRPWRGRALTPQPFAGDDGSAPSAFSDAISAFRSGASRPEDVVDALRGARLLIPLIAELGESGTNAHGRAVDKRADLSIVTVAAPDGRAALPVFTSVAELTAWRADARPVPVEAARAAVAAIDDGTELMIVNPGSDDEFGVRRPAVWAIARGAAWLRPWRQPRVLEALAGPLAEVPRVAAVDLAPASAPGSLAGPELAVTIRVAGLDAAGRSALAAQLAASWAADAVVVELVDSLSVAVTPASNAGDQGSSPQSDDSDPPAPPSPARRGLSGWFRTAHRS